jgi:hypothetical protein
MKKIIGITGYGNSGKSAVTDYLKQYDTMFSFPSQVEFELFRVSGGLLDLYTSIYYPYCLIRVQKRIKEFEKLIRRIGRVQTIKDPLSYLYASRHNYNKLFNDRFFEISQEYIDKIVEKKIESFWPYKNLQVHPYMLFYNKIKGKLFGSLVMEDVIYTNRNVFLEATTKYIQKLFSEVTTPKQTHILLSNSFEPYNPSPCMDMAGDAFSIIVERDPRDIYANLIDKNNIFIPEGEKYKNSYEVKKKITSFNKIDEFIYRYRNLRENVVSDKEVYNDARILRLRYEDFITDHDKMAEKVKKFIQLPEQSKIIHNYFDVSKSIKNVGIWKRYAQTDDIKLIEKELTDYCYQS